jgi:hypothetical protein
MPIRRDPTDGAVLPLDATEASDPRGVWFGTLADVPFTCPTTWIADAWAADVGGRNWPRRGDGPAVWFWVGVEMRIERAGRTVDAVASTIDPAADDEDESFLAWPGAVRSGNTDQSRFGFT